MGRNIDIYHGRNIHDERIFFGLPQFVAINFIFDIYNPDDIIKSLILSELPPLLKKYDIKLNNNDINIFISNIYNLTKEIEFKQKIGLIEEIENMSYVKDADKVMYLKLARDFYNIYQKIIKFDMKDKLIEKMIYDRYNYYFNKYDNSSYKNFQTFLNNNIPQNGYFDVEQMTDESLSECEMNWVDIQEQKVRDFFYDIKHKIYPNKPIIFQSIRFYYVYLYLRGKYPEIDIECAELDNMYIPIIQKLKSVYVNDIYGDKQYKNIFNDYVVLLPFQLSTILCNSRDMINHFFDIDKEQRKQIYNEHYNSRRKVTYRSAESIDEVINLLEYERRIMKKDGVFLESIYSIPEMFMPYFAFCMQNQNQIEYFKKRIKEESDKNKIIEEMIEIFGKQGMFKLLVDLLLDGKLINHELITNHEITIQKRKIKNIREWRKLYESNNTKRKSHINRTYL